MHRELVEPREWIAEDDYTDGLAIYLLAAAVTVITESEEAWLFLAPGYSCGWCGRHRISGGSAVECRSS